MKCKTCGFDVPEGQAYSCGRLGACDFSPDFKTEIEKLKAGVISYDNTEQGYYESGYEAAIRDFLKLFGV